MINGLRENLHWVTSHITSLLKNLVCASNGPMHNSKTPMKAWTLFAAAHRQATTLCGTVRRTVPTRTMRTAFIFAVLSNSFHTYGQKKGHMAGLMATLHSNNAACGVVSNCQNAEGGPPRQLVVQCIGCRTPRVALYMDMYGGLHVAGV